MQRIPPPSGQGISNVVGGLLFDGRLSGGSYHGPFDTVQDFHRHLREGYEGGNDDARPTRTGSWNGITNIAANQYSHMGI